MTLTEIASDIKAMEERLRHYERKYGLRSPQFFELYHAGRLRDKDPAEVRDYGDWAACYDIKLDITCILFQTSSTTVCRPPASLSRNLICQRS